MTDRSTNETVVEYAVRYLFKGKTPKAAAQATVRKLSGQENFFLGPGVTTLDVKKLEDAIWNRLVDITRKAVRHYKPGMEHMAVGGTALQFRQGPKVEEELRRRVARTDPSRRHRR